MLDRKISEAVNYEGREFIIKKMTPFKGIAVLKTLLTRALPIDLLSSFSDSEEVSRMFSGMSKDKKDMTEEEFIELELELMKTVSENLKGGPTPVIDDRGNFQVEDLENNMLLVVWLLVKVVEVNYKDFFIEMLQKAGLITKLDNIPEQMQQIIKSV